jgi:hypothetical protein
VRGNRDPGPRRQLGASADRCLSILSLAASAVAAHLSGMLAVRPGRDRARPAGPRAVSWIRLHGKVTTALQVGARAGAAGALIP